MKRRMTAVFLALTLFCTGCGESSASKAPSAPPVEEKPAPVTEVPAPAPENATDDYVLAAMELPPLKDGRVLTCRAIGKKQADLDRWGVRELQIFDGEVLLQTLSVQDAIDTDGVSGALGDGYTDCPAIDQLIGTADMNFDENPDISLFAWTPAGANIPRYYWLWDEEGGAFRYGFWLSNAVPDPENEQILCTTTQNRGFSTEYYAYDPQGALQLVYSVSESYQPDGSLVREAYRLVDGAWIREE